MNSNAYPPVGVAMIIAAIGRTLVMERNLGVTIGHKEARAMVDAWLQAAQPRKPRQSKK